MTTEFRVRRAQATDAHQLARLRWEFKQEEHGGGHAEARPEARAAAWISERLGSGRWLAWVAECDAGIRGHVFLNLVERVPEPYEENTPIGYVTNFYVDVRYRNRGFGTALLRAVREHAGERGVDVLFVWPSERSVPIYRRAGFRPPGEMLEAR
ncbi:GNAT family N-acetyltransferase [Streptomyces sulphureus]|uniref:GNAT family N-acetyltransferase n=1 Tax=Streptomyces sulphureus TaxID=47758 RepID=UPI00056384B0|nr:GNAT family N-acetyltransferase [Streptomyces sulphureus]